MSPGQSGRWPRQSLVDPGRVAAPRRCRRVSPDRTAAALVALALVGLVLHTPERSRAGIAKRAPMTPEPSRSEVVAGAFCVQPRRSQPDQQSQPIHLTVPSRPDTVVVVPIGSVVVCLAIAGLAFAESRSRAAGEWRLLAVVTLGALAVLVFERGGVVTSTLFGQPLVVDMVLAAGAVLIAVDLIGLPLPVARRLRLGLHSREWEFHRRLFALTEEARRAVDGSGGSGGPEPSDLPKIIARTRALRAPSQEWADLRDGWASIWERYHTARAAPADASTLEEYLALNESLIEQTHVLIARYRSDAARIQNKGS